MNDTPWKKNREHTTGELDFHLTGLREMGTSEPIDHPLEAADEPKK